jgi:hypothetical protein
MSTKLLKVNSSSFYEGYEKGENCNRYISDVLLNRICDGIINEYDTDTSCTCHTGHPPCSHCVDSQVYCPKCGWDGYYEQCSSNW